MVEYNVIRRDKESGDIEYGFSKGQMIQPFILSLKYVLSTPKSRLASPARCRRVNGALLQRNSLSLTLYWASTAGLHKEKYLKRQSKKHVLWS